MTYEMALDYEQQQKAEQALIAAEWREIEEYEAQHFGQGTLCSCGMMIAADCNCPF